MTLGVASRRVHVAALLVVAAVMALLALCGCGKEKASVLAPAPPPLAIESVWPEPGSVGVPELPEIGARFAVPLDSGSVSVTSAFLKLDTQFIPVRVRWERSTRTLTLVPLATLRLGRTHTVRLTTALVAEGGARLERDHVWQFRTSGAGAPRGPWPADGSVPESPHVSLLWEAVLADSADIRYHVYAGYDSARLAARADPARAEVGRPEYAPTRPWNRGETTYWSVTVRNRRTGESLDGPVWRFATFPPGAPLDSVQVLLTDWTTYDRVNDSLACMLSQFTVGSRFQSAIRWDLRPVGPRRIAYAYVTLVYTTGGNFLLPQLAAPVRDWRACDPLELPDRGIEFGAFRRWSFPTLRLQNDALAVHVEAALRLRRSYGFVPWGTTQVDFTARGSMLTLAWFREGAASADGAHP